MKSLVLVISAAELLWRLNTGLGVVRDVVDRDEGCAICGRAKVVDGRGLRAEDVETKDRWEEEDARRGWDLRSISEVSVPMMRIRTTQTRMATRTGTTVVSF